jgi:hypothetical protein
VSERQKQREREKDKEELNEAKKQIQRPGNRYRERG